MIGSALRSASLLSRLSEGVRGPVRHDELVAPHTSFNVGGPADIWIEPIDLADLAAAVRILRQHDCPVTVLGNGTNCLVADLGIRGAVVSLMRSFRDVTLDGEVVCAGSGVSMPLLSQQMARAGLTGYEWACGIPGSVGGSVVMNAGAHDGDTAGCLVEVQEVSPDGLDGWTPAADLGFGYRRSNLRGEKRTEDVGGSAGSGPAGTTGRIITAARFRFHTDDPDRIRRRLQEYREKRRASQPDTSVCAGSIFKNPPGGSAGRLLEGLGAKRMRVGGAEVSEKHANFIVNSGGAQASDVRSLMRLLQEMAREKAGVCLESEVLMMGEWPSEE